MPAESPTVLCRLEELDDPGSRSLVIRHAGHDYDIFVVRSGATARAYLNSCPHTGAPLDWMPDQFLNQDRTLIQCAMHAALFRIDDGLCVAGPCAGDALSKLPTAIEDGILVFYPQRFQPPEAAG